MKLNELDKGRPGIYCIINLKNNKKYVGKSMSIYTRVSQHINLLNAKSKDENRYLISSWHKHGKDNFSYEVLYYCELIDNIIEDLKEKELFWILKLNTLDKNYGYNLRLDSSSNMIVHKDTRELMSKNRKKNYLENPERAKNISIFFKNYWKNNLEGKNKMSQKLSKINTKFSIVQMDRQLNIIAEYPSQKYIRDNHPEFYLQAILGVCNGGKASYKGFYWRYKCVKTGEIKFQKERELREKSVVRICLETNNILETYPTGAIASVLFESGSYISAMCIRKTFPKQKNYYWRFEKDYLNKVNDIIHDLEPKQLTLF